MNLLRLGLGVLSIIGGASALSKGVGHISGGLKGTGGSAGDPRRGVQTKVIKRQRRKLPALRQGLRQAQVANGMRVTLKSVNTLDDRLAQIIELAEEGKFDPKVIAFARSELTKKCRPSEWNGSQWCVAEKDDKAEIEAIFKALRKNVRYTYDIHGADTYASPGRTLQLASGDCDDFSSLGCAALMSVGIPCRFKVIQTKKSSTPDHIYIQAGYPRNNPQRWVSLDASVPMPPGWEAPASMVAKEWIYEV